MLSKIFHQNFRCWLVENLTEEELDADVDLLRQIFKEEKNVFDMSDQGVKQKFLEKVENDKKREIMKKKQGKLYCLWLLEFSRKWSQQRKIEIEKVDRHKVPGTFAYQQVISARNYLKELRSKEYKWVERDAHEHYRQSCMERLEKKMNTARQNYEKVWI